MKPLSLSGGRQADTENGVRAKSPLDTCVGCDGQSLQRDRGEADCIWEAGVEEGGSELVGRDNVVFREELPAMGVGEVGSKLA